MLTNTLLCALLPSLPFTSRPLVAAAAEALAAAAAIVVVLVVVADSSRSSSRAVDYSLIIGNTKLIARRLLIHVIHYQLVMSGD